jgi:hypothetical protein
VGDPYIQDDQRLQQALQQKASRQQVIRGCYRDYPHVVYEHVLLLIEAFPVAQRQCSAGVMGSIEQRYQILNQHASSQRCMLTCLTGIFQINTAWLITAACCAILIYIYIITNQSDIRQSREIYNLDPLMGLLSVLIPAISLMYSSY